MVWVSVLSLYFQEKSSGCRVLQSLFETPISSFSTRSEGPGTDENLSARRMEREKPVCLRLRLSVSHRATWGPSTKHNGHYPTKKLNSSIRCDFYTLNSCFHSGASHQGVDRMTSTPAEHNAIKFSNKSRQLQPQALINSSSSLDRKASQSSIHFIPELYCVVCGFVLFCPCSIDVNIN